MISYISLPLQIMPIHCAAINPNPKMLEKLLSVVPELNLADYKGKKIIHYAAACTGSGPLELLLQRLVLYWQICSLVSLYKFLGDGDIIPANPSK